MGNPRIVRALWLFAALALVSAAPVEAHPLGNFSISQYTALQIGEDAVALRYFIDMAEIPTFQELQAREIPADPTDARVAPYLRETADALAKGLVLEVDGRRLPLDVKSADVIFPPGAADLPTMKLAVLMTAPLEKSRGAVQALRYRDENFAARAGWKEVIATGRAGSAIVESSVPDRDRSRELSDYPIDLLDAPPQVREARVRFSRVPPPLAEAPMAPAAPGPSPADAAPSAPPATPRAETAPERARIPAALEASVVARTNAQSVSRGGFADLIATRELTLSVVAVALAVAAALGAFHALEPGHGKTVVAVTSWARGARRGTR